MIPSDEDIENESGKNWRRHLDERQLKEIEFARQYSEDFAHGTDGHHRLIIIAKLAMLLDILLAPDE